MSIDQLLKEAAQLPDDQKLTLAHRLLMASEPPASDDVEHAWDLVIRDRIQEFDQGRGQSRPAGDVFSNLDRRLGS